MSRRTRTALYATSAFAIMVLMIFLMAWQQGVDPLHPRTRMYWLLAVVVALYVSIRGAIFIERMQFRKTRELPEDERPNRHSSDIRDRMAARKARVEAARKKAAERGDS